MMCRLQRGSFPTLKEEKKMRQLFLHRCGICEFKGLTTLLFSLTMTRNAIGRMKRLANCRDQLAGMFSHPRAQSSAL